MEPVGIPSLSGGEDVKCAIEPSSDMSGAFRFGCEFASEYASFTGICHPPLSWPVFVKVEPHIQAFSLQS